MFIEDFGLVKANKNTVGNRRADFPLALGGLPGYRLRGGAFHPRISQIPWCFQSKPATLLKEVKDRALRQLSGCWIWAVLLKAWLV